jgi:hypothetical protein
MELELKHIAPYLPYKLQMLFYDIKVGELTRISNYDWESHPTRMAIDTNDSEHIWMFKPILYPLDLTKPIWFEGKEIVPFDFLTEKFLGDIKGNNVSHWGYRTVDMMIQMKLDVFGLIPKDFAISVHDVDSEIYKNK